MPPTRCRAANSACVSTGCIGILTVPSVAGHTLFRCPTECMINPIKREADGVFSRMIRETLGGAGAPGPKTPRMLDDLVRSPRAYRIAEECLPISEYLLPPRVTSVLG
jgi:hypothetical protein